MLVFLNELFVLLIVFYVFMDYCVCGWCASSEYEGYFMHWKPTSRNICRTMRIKRKPTNLYLPENLIQKA